jgi:hypothetical protein
MVVVVITIIIIIILIITTIGLCASISVDESFKSSKLKGLDELTGEGNQNIRTKLWLILVYEKEPLRGRRGH